MATDNDKVDREIAKELVRRSFDLMGVADDKGYFVFLNDRWPDVLGWSIKELTSRPFIEFVHPDDVTASKQAAALPHMGKTVMDFENRQRTKSGDYRWIQWRSTALLDDGRIYFNSRSHSGYYDKAFARKLRPDETMRREAWSDDGGLGFSRFAFSTLERWYSSAKISFMKWATSARAK